MLVGARGLNPADTKCRIVVPGAIAFVERGWNAGDEPARVLEIISPAGLDELVRELGALGDALDPDTMATLAARYGAQVDFERTFPIVERHGLKF